MEAILKTPADTTTEKEQVESQSAHHYLVTDPATGKSQSIEATSPKEALAIYRKIKNKK